MDDRVAKVGNGAVRVAHPVSKQAAVVQHRRRNRCRCAGLLLECARTAVSQSGQSNTTEIHTTRRPTRGNPQTFAKPGVLVKQNRESVFHFPRRNRRVRF